MDGFPNHDKKWVVVLSAPSRRGYPFVGIKASVLIVDPIKIDEKENMICKWSSFKYFKLNN